MTVLLSAEQVRELLQQAAAREGGERAAVVTGDGRVFTRSTAGLPATALALWRQEPTMAVADGAGYTPTTVTVPVGDL